MGHSESDHQNQITKKTQKKRLATSQFLPLQLLMTIKAHFKLNINFWIRHTFEWNSIIDFGKCYMLSYMTITKIHMLEIHSKYVNIFTSDGP